MIPTHKVPFLANLQATSDFYKAMCLTFAKQGTVSEELVVASLKLKVWVAQNRPDVDQKSWIHSWQESSTLNDQIGVALELGL